MQRFFTSFRRFLRVLGVATILATLAVTAWADEAWRVSEVTGSARVNQGDGTWTAVVVGTVIAPGGIVETGANGRVVLKSAKDEATMSPNSRMAAPKPGEAQNSNIVQKLGTLLFKIERAPSRRFAVDTPYLAAVVKGTTFTVTVGADSGLVHVTEGAVLVASFGSRETALVTPGQTAQVVAAGGKLQVIERGRTVPAAPPSGDGKGKQGSKEGDPADQKLIEKGRVELAQAIAGAADKGKDEGKVGPIVSAKSDRSIQVAALDGGSASRGRPSSSVLVISKTLGAESIDVARATDGFIAGLPAKPAAVTRRILEKDRESTNASVGDGRSETTTSKVSAPTTALANAAPAPTPVVDAPAPTPTVTGLMPLGGALPSVIAPIRTLVPNAVGDAAASSVNDGSSSGGLSSSASAPASAPAPAPTVSASPATAATPAISAPIIPPPAPPVLTMPVVTTPVVAAPVVATPVVSAPVISVPVVSPVVATLGSTASSITRGLGLGR